jgi:hypothetical protein
MTTEEQEKTEESNSASDVPSSNEKTSKHGPRTCENPDCGQQFIPLNSRAKYCSPSCNAKASQIRRGLRPATASQVQNIPAQQSAQTPIYTPQQTGGLNGLFAIPPHADMMINHYKGEAARWEKKYDSEVADHKVTKQKLEDAKEELRDNEKPGGLNGFLESTSGVELVKAFAPVIAGAMSNRMQQQQIAGTAGSEMTQLFGEWTSKLKEESQQTLWAVIQKLSNMDEEQMNYTLKGLLQSWQH